METVYYIAANQLKVYEWNDRQLLGSADFSSDESGLEAFAAYLSQSRKHPVRVLVDVVEEDFRQETIPKVAGKDREALISRLLDRHYRDAPHNHVISQGTVKVDGRGSRTEEKLLFSALTGMEYIDVWLKLMEEHGMSVSGIWSVPLLTAELLKKLSIDDDNVLLVTRQLQHLIRETCFRKGHFHLSRHAILDKTDVESLSQNLNKGVDQIQRFLTNQRIMGFNEELKVYALFPQAELTELSELCSDTATTSYHFLGLESVYDKMGLSLFETHDADSLYAWLCSKQSVFKDHYALVEEKLGFHQHLLNRVINATTHLGALLVMTAASLTGLNALEMNQKREQVDNNYRLLYARYQELYQPVAEQLQVSDSIEKSVDLAEHLNREAQQVPQAYFDMLSTVYSAPGFSDFHLRSMDWKKYKDTELDTQRDSNDELNEIVGSRSEYDDYDNYDNNQDNDGDSYSSPELALTLSGFFDRKQRPYRQTVKVFNEYISALKQSPLVKQVQIIKMPVDVRPGVDFKDKSGLIKSSLPLLNAANEYRVFIILGGSNERKNSQ